MEKYAVIVVDMLKDNLESEKHSGIAPEGRKIVPRIRELLEAARPLGVPVIYACDSFLPGDFIFEGRMKPHSLRGTEGAKVIDELAPQPGDMILEKRRMSSFFKTDLDLTLNMLGVKTILVAGIATPVCVLLTAMDGISYGFKAVIIEDCTAAHKPEIHRATLELYRKSGLYPLLRIMTLAEILPEFKPSKGSD